MSIKSAMDGRLMLSENFRQKILAGFRITGRVMSIMSAKDGRLMLSENFRQKILAGN